MRYFLFSFSVTIIIYLLASFVRWDIFWLRDLGDWEWGIRLIMTIFLLIKEIYCIIVYTSVKEVKEFFSFKKNK